MKLRILVAAIAVLSACPLAKAQSYVLPFGITPIVTLVSVGASSTQLAKANQLRRALQISCDGTAAVGISQIGATLTGNTLSGGADTVLPATTTNTVNTYIPPFATRSVITAFGAATPQNCVIVEWNTQ